MRHSRLSRSLASIFAGFFVFSFAALPASAVGGGTVWVKADRVWRTQTFGMADYKVPEGCPGSTTRKLSVTARFQGGPKGFWIKNIRIKNKSNVTLDQTVSWNDRLKYMRPGDPKWTQGVVKRMYDPAWVDGGGITKTYQAWAGSKKDRAVIPFSFREPGGETQICLGVYQILFKKW